MKFDNESGQTIPKSDIENAIREFSTHINFFSDVEDGMFTISSTEYNNLPALLIDFWRTYKAAKSNKKADIVNTQNNMRKNNAAR